MRDNALAILLLAILTSAQLGCATAHHTAGRRLSVANQVERGRPNEFVDTVGNVFSIPSKLLLWNRKIDNHCVTEQTECEIRNYIAANGLDTTKVRLNQYDPVGEWNRLIDNKSMPALARYTLGTWHNIGYTLCPGRLFGGDKYNPYTDTLSVYSDIPAMSMAEIAYAKDLRSRQHPGWYAFGQELPILGMVHESIATDDVLSYLAVHDDTASQFDATRILYPRYGAVFGEQIGSFFPHGDAPFVLAGGVIGHFAGRKRADDIVQTSYTQTDQMRGQNGNH